MIAMTTSSSTSENPCALLTINWESLCIGCTSNSDTSWSILQWQFQTFARHKYHRTPLARMPFKIKKLPNTALGVVASV